MTFCSVNCPATIYAAVGFFSPDSCISVSTLLVSAASTPNLPNG